MADDKPERPEQPMIRFGADWIPAHLAWHKMTTANVVADAIERFNRAFPQLASAQTREVVPLVRGRLKAIELYIPTECRRPDLPDIAARLLDSGSLEDAVATLRDRHGVQLDLAQLIQLAGDRAYRTALRREAREYASNGISPEQTAQLWNDAERPAPGGDLWTGPRVEQLLSAPDGV